MEKEHIVDSGGLAALLGLTDASDVRTSPARRHFASTRVNAAKLYSAIRQVRVLRCVAAAFVNLTVSMELKARFLEAGGLVALNTLVCAL